MSAQADVFSTEIPDFREELNRKVIETLSEIEHRVNTGQYSFRDRQIALETITESVQGLVDKDIIDALGCVLEGLSKTVIENKVQRILVTRAGSPVIVTLDYSKDEIRISRLKNGVLETSVKDLDPLDATSPLDHFNYLTNTLERSGAKVIE